LRFTADAWQADAEIFATPTGLWMSAHRPGEEPVVRLVRVQQWSIALDRLAAIDGVFNDFAAQRIDIATAHQRLDAIEATPPHGGPAVILAGALASGSAAIFFGGDWLIAGLGALVGLISTALSVGLARGAQTKLLIDFAVGLMVGLAAWLAAIVDPSLPRKPLVLAGLIVNVPGLGLTAGLSELAQKNLVSGAARLLDATMVGVSLLFGVGAIATIERAVHPHHIIALTSEISLAPVWMLILATLVAAIAFIVLFNVPRKDAPMAVLAAGIAWGAAYGAERLGISGAAGAFFGALFLGLFAHEQARRRDRPAQLMLVPGIVLLVPGAFGFVAVDQLLWGDPAQGAAGLVQTMLIAGGLSIGLVLAGALRPPRKFL
jgi:uncharacterized membrane protein YjjP (DUF1212 family)